MKISKIEEIIKIIEQAKIDVLHIEEDGFKLYYEKNKTVSIDPSKTSPITQARKTDLEEPRDKNNYKSSDDSLHKVTSPMIGSFYSKSNPEAEPFVQVGSNIAKDDTLCVIESMKLLNEVSADIDGEIIEILVEDGQMIEFNQPLFLVKESK